MHIFKFLLLILTVFSTAFCYAQSAQYYSLADSADIYLSKEQWEKAEAVILQALRLEPANFSNSFLLSNMGVALTHQGKMEEALNSFNLALSISPNSTVALNNRAKCNLYFEKDEDALSDLCASLEIDDRQEWPLQTRGFLYLKNGELEKAKEDFNSLLTINSKNDMALYGMGNVYENLNFYDDALRYYNDAININEDPDFHLASIRLKLNNSKYQQARDEINECVAKYPQNPMFYLYRGCLHKLNYRNEESEADAKIAIAKGLDPQFVREVFDNMKR